MTRLSRCLLAGLVCLLAATLLAQDKKPDPAQLEKDFTELLTNSVLVGRFTTDGQEGMPKEDRYSIGKVGKVQGTDDSWVFTGIKYGNKEIAVPLVIKVVFADGSPVMTMDELTIPNLGTFSFRIIFHGKRYAGSWQHDDHGGHMWGRVEKQKPDGAKPAEDKKTSLSDRLKKKVTVNYKDQPLTRVIDDLGERLNLRFEVHADDLKAAGVTLNARTTLAVEDKPAFLVLQILFRPLGLNMVVDKPKEVIHVTSIARAATLQRELGLEPPPKPAPTLKEQLQKRIAVDFKNQPLAASIDAIGTKIGVKFELAGDDVGLRLNQERSVTYDAEPASAILHKLFRHSDLCAVAVQAKGIVLIVTEKHAEENGLRPIDSEKLSVPSALKDLCSTNYEGLPLRDAIKFLFELHEVPYTVLEDDLKAEGISLDQKVTLNVAGLTGAEVLHRILHPAKLCVVLDESRTKAKITTATSAKARNWSVYQLRGTAAGLE